MYYFRTTHRSEVEVTRTVTRTATEPQWDRDDTKTFWTLGDTIELVSENEGFDITVDDFEPIHGEDYYLLSVEYSTGDSFGHDESERVEDVALYQTRAEAEVVAELIRKGPEKNSFQVKLPNGGSIYAPWVGYFERLEEIHITRVEAKMQRKPFSH